MKIFGRPIKWIVRVALFHIKVWIFIDRLRAYCRFKMGVPHESDFLFFKQRNDTFKVFVDIGANAGQSALSVGMLRPEMKIISFEPNSLMKPELDFAGKLLGKRFEYRTLGLGEAPSHSHFFIPIVDGVPLTQETTIVKDLLLSDKDTKERIYEATGATDFKIETLKLKIEPFDAMTLKPDFVKIDVQGSELQVLRGMKETLRRYKPVLMIENGVGMGPIIEELSQLGYMPCYFNQNEKRLVPNPSNQEILNLFFVPNPNSI